jgi:hypothetical protein
MEPALSAMQRLSEMKRGRYSTECRQFHPVIDVAAAFAGGVLA